MKVSPRAHRYQDASGDPLDGLVNLFDVGIVLAVAFLLAALSSLNLSGALSESGKTRAPKNTITVGPKDTVKSVPTNAPRTAGQGTEVGRVYRLKDGRLIYVVPGTASPGAGGSVPSDAPVPSPTPTR